MRFIVDESTGYGVAHYLQDEGGFNRVQVMTALMNQYSEQLPGRFVVVTEKKVRFRPPQQK